MSHISPLLGKKNASNNSGEVGYVLSNAISSVSIPTAGTTVNALSLSVPAGIWMLFGSYTMTSAQSGLYFAISTSSSSNDDTGSRSGALSQYATTSLRSGTIYRYYRSTSTATVYLNATSIAGSSGSNSAGYCTFYAVRIA